LNVGEREKSSKMRRRAIVILPRLYDANGDINKPWFVDYSYRNPKTGKMQRFRISQGFRQLKSANDRYELADKIIKEYTDKIKGGWTPFDCENVIYDDLTQYANVAKIYGKKRKGNLTLKVYINEFLEETKFRVCKKSFESYQSKIRLFVQWLEREGQEGNDISCLTEEMILNFFDYLIKERKLQGRTIQKYGVNLRQLFIYLVKKKHIFKNPMPEVPKVPNKVDMSARPINNADVAKLKDMIKRHDPQLWLAIQFEFYCYIRPGNELRHMKINWIDFTAGTITVPAYMEINGEYEQIAKNKKTQMVLIPGQFLNELIHVYHLDKYDRDLFLFGPDRMPGERPMGKNTLRVRFNKYRDALGLSKEYKLYSWKHTGGISAHKSGIPIKDIQTQMRHKDLSVTDTYFKRMLPTESEHLRNNYPTI
jgi:integrase